MTDNTIQKILDEAHMAGYARALEDEMEQTAREADQAAAFHKAFDEISAECEAKGFRLPSSTDFGFGWKKAKEYYARHAPAYQSGEVERLRAALEKIGAEYHSAKFSTTEQLVAILDEYTDTARQALEPYSPKTSTGGTQEGE